jgi:hypothetical protein
VLTARDAIWFRLTDGQRIEAPIQRRTRPARPQMVKRGSVLDSDDFDRVVEQLRQRVRD